MITTSPIVACQDLDALRPVLYKAIEAGVSEAREYFALKDRDYEPYTFSSLFRLEARTRLNDLGHEAEFDVDESANNLGLHLRYLSPPDVNGVRRVYNLRIRKAFGGSAPVPGHSYRTQDFYKQAGFIQTVLPGFEQDATNLLVLWDVTADWMLRPDLILACPLGTARFGSSPPCLWKVPLAPPHESLTTIPLPLVQPGDDEDLGLDFVARAEESRADTGA